MNLSPPPQFGISNEAKGISLEDRIQRLEKIVQSNENRIQDILSWLRDVYEFLKYPVFHLIRLLPRTAPTSDTAEEGVIYYDEDDDKVKVYTTSFEDLN